MGWFSNDGPNIVDFDAVLSGGVIWPAYTDEHGVLFIDVDYDVSIVVDEVLIGDMIYPAWVDDDGQLRIEFD